MNDEDKENIKRIFDNDTISLIVIDEINSALCVQAEEDLEVKKIIFDLIEGLDELSGDKEYGSLLLDIEEFRKIKSRFLGGVK